MVYHSTMTMKPHCPNMNDREFHDGWYDSDMSRLYIRTNETERVPALSYQTKTKRKWVPVGWYCPKCHAVKLDELLDAKS